MITNFFSDPDNTGLVAVVCGEGKAQPFVDIIDQVPPRRCIGKIGLLNRHPHLSLAD